MNVFDSEYTYRKINEDPSIPTNRASSPQINDLSQILFNQAISNENSINKVNFNSQYDLLCNEIQSIEQFIKGISCKSDPNIRYAAFLKENTSIRNQLIDIKNKIFNISIENPLKSLQKYELKLNFQLKGSGTSYTIPYELNHFGKKWIFWLKRRNNKMEFIIDFFLRKQHQSDNFNSKSLEITFNLHFLSNGQINKLNPIVYQQKFKQSQFNSICFVDISNKINDFPSLQNSLIELIFSYEIVYFP